MESEDNDDKQSSTQLKPGSRLGKKDFSEQTQSVVINVYKFFQRLADDPDIVKDLNFKQVQKLTAEACGISRSSVHSIKKKMKIKKEKKQPMVNVLRKHKRRGLRSDMDSGHLVQLKVECDPCEVESFEEQSIEEDAIRHPAEVNTKIEEDPLQDETVLEDETAEKEKTVEEDAGYPVEVSDNMKEERLENESMEEQLVYPTQVPIKVERISDEEEYAEEDKGLQISLVQVKTEDGDACVPVDRDPFEESNLHLAESEDAFDTEGIIQSLVRQSIQMIMPQVAEGEGELFNRNTVLNSAKNVDSRMWKKGMGEAARRVSVKSPDCSVANGNETQAIILGGIVDRRRSYQCGICNKVFNHKGHLRVHIRWHMREKTYKCYNCRKEFSQSSQLKEHTMERTCGKRYECSWCNKVFLRLSRMREHERVHTRVKPYKCNYCVKEFSHRGQLKEHTSEHTCEKRLKCSWCDKAFYLVSRLREHERVHTQVKPYKCNSCNKEFSRKSNLNRHKMIHSGETPYVCTFCAKGFICRSDFKRHERIHAKVKPYKCELCAKEYSQRRTLKWHKLVHAKERQL